MMRFLTSAATATVCRGRLLLLLLLIHVNTGLAAFTRDSRLDDDNIIEVEEDNDVLQSLARQIAVSASHSGLVWSNLSVRTIRSEVPRLLVESFSGELTGGEICGLLGPSGAGKSTFVSALAGTQTLPQAGHVYKYHDETKQSIKDDKSSSSSSSSHLDHHHHRILLESIRPNQVAWLQQQDSFFEMLTVREILELAAFLELPHLTRSQRCDLIQQKLTALGLTQVEHRRVGHYLRHGASRLSGGERRRLSVALELLTEKSLLIADEPTTGLDSTMSARVMKLIKDTVQELDIPALCVLHQPRSSVWHSLDSVILMAPGGRVCFAGKRSEAIAYFRALGYPCPEATNPAEFFVDLISIDPEIVEKAAEDEQRVSFLADEFRRYQQKLWDKRSGAAKEIEFVFASPPKQSNSKHSTPAFGDGEMDAAAAVVERKRPSLFRWIPRLGSLLRRSWRQNYRNSVTNTARFVMSVMNAFLMTQLFPTIRGKIPTANSMADRAAMLTTCLVIIMNMAFMKSADLFEREYPVVRREQMRHQYSTLEYLLAKVLAEIPLDCFFAAVFSFVMKQFSGIRIGWKLLTATNALLTAAGASLGFLLGGIFARDGLAINAGLPLLVILMVVGVINPSGVDPNRPPPAMITFLKKFSPFAYAVNAILIAEYKDMKFKKTTDFFSRVRDLPKLGAIALVQDGNQVIDALGLSDETYMGSMKNLGLLTLGNLFFSWIGLSLQQRRPDRKRDDQADDGKRSFGAAMNGPIIRRVRI